MHDNPRFGPQARACFAKARQKLDARQRDELIAEVEAIIEPFDVAGLTQDRDNWYPVLAEDLFSAKEKVGATRPDIELLLQRAGF